MESLAQKKAKANFKKAIEYRKKTGCSLKEAFAYVSEKKVVAKKTVVKKRSSSPLKKKKAIKKVGTIKKKAVTVQKKHMFSGFEKNVLDIYKRGLDAVVIYQSGIKEFQNKLAMEKDLKQKAIIRKGIKLQKLILKELITHNKEIKKRL